MVLLNIPVVQRKMASYAVATLKELLDTELSIGKVSVGTLNRIIVDDLLLWDRTGKEMLKVSRLSAKFELLPLFRGRIAINNVQLFGFNVALSKDTPQDDLNFQFVVDAFASKDSIEKKTNLDLRINSLLIRRGNLSYDVRSEPETSGKFDPKHVLLQNIIANVSLKTLRNDSVNVAVKRMSLTEKSGFELGKLSFKLMGNTRQMRLENFSVALPNTSFNLDTVTADYDGWEAFGRIADDVRFSVKTLPSYVTLQDIACFVPAFGQFGDKMNLYFELGGTIDQLDCPRLEIDAGDNLQLKGNVSFQDLSQGGDAYIYGNLSEFRLKRSGIEFLFRNLSGDNSRIPAVLKRVGDVSFRGEISGYFNDWVTYGVFRSDLGTVKTDLKLSIDKERGVMSSSGSVKAVDFALGRCLGKEMWGNVCFNVDISAVKYAKAFPKVKVKGLVSSIECNGHDYRDIELDGIYEDGGFDGRISLNDAYANVLLIGNFNWLQDVPVFNFQASVKDVFLHELNLSRKYEGMGLSLNLNANFRGKSIDDMIGEIDVDSVYWRGPDKNLFIDRLSITAQQVSETEKRLTLKSPYLTALVEGTYSYRTIPASLIKTVERYIPSLLTLNKEMDEPDNKFVFDVEVYNTEDLSEAFGLPFTNYSHATVKGYFNDVVRKLQVEGYFPAFRYGKHFVESGIVLCENPSDRFRCLIRGNRHLKGDSSLSFSVDAEARNDKLVTSVNWGNDAEVTYGGRLSALTDFRKTEGDHPVLRADVRIEPTEVILNDSVWNIRPSRITVDSGRVCIDNFLFEHGKQHLRINGKLTNDLQDTVKVELNEINIGYVFDIVQLKDVNFSGMATGVATASQVFKSPELNADLFIRDFRFNDALLGDMNVIGKWDKEEEGIFLDARATEKDISRTNVYGLIYPKKKGLDLQIEVDNTNVHFLQFYMKSISSDVRGCATGRAHFFGGFKSLQLEGSVWADATMKFDILNTSFQVTDSVRLRPSEIQFTDCTMRDPEGHTGKLNGYLRHKHFKELSYRFRMDVNNMLVYDAKEEPDLPFYGTVYGTGSVLLNGGVTGLDIDVAMTTNRNTNFVYMLNSTTSAADNQFINFVDKTPKREVYDSIYVDNRFYMARQETSDSPIDIRLNLQVDATPDGNMKIIMDPVAGDYISGRGNGNIRVEFFNKGDVKMFGRYDLEQGIYKFSLQEVIRKDFIIKSGSSIDFNGNPLDANLDIQAAYTVNSASLTDLGIGETFSQNNVKVNCIMNLTGNLTGPDIRFDIELPNVSEEEREIVRSAISTDEEMNMQILYLLGIGKFYTYDYANNRSGQSSNAMSSMLSSTLSGQLNNILSQALNLHNWNFGTSLSTGEKGWTDMEIEGILSGQLLNNRLLINGNFGYKDNPMANTNFVGDFDVEWLLTKSGEVRLKVYNQTNDRYYTKTTLTTQGVGIAYKRDFNTWKDVLLWRSKLKRKREARLQTDSIQAGQAGR